MTDAKTPGAPPPFVIAISGSNGLLGDALLRVLHDDVREFGGRPLEIVHIVKTSTYSGDVRHYAKDRVAVVAPQYTHLDLDQLEYCDVLIHLSGDTQRETFDMNGGDLRGSAELPLLDMGSWSEERKEELQRGKAQFTELLVNIVRSLKVPPKLFINASDASFYGPSEEPSDETTLAGKDVLAIECKVREQIASRLENVCRVINLRLGLIISPKGGFVRRLLSLFQQGIVGRIGPGNQWHSFISEADAVNALVFLMNSPAAESLSGPVNICAPYAARNTELTECLLEVLGRAGQTVTSALSPIDVKYVFGELPNDVLNLGRWLQPKRLLDAGFSFEHPDISSALRWLYEKAQTCPRTLTLADDQYFTATPAPSLAASNSADDSRGRSPSDVVAP